MTMKKLILHPTVYLSLFLLLFPTCKKDSVEPTDYPQCYLIKDIYRSEGWDDYITYYEYNESGRLIHCYTDNANAYIEYDNHDRIYEIKYLYENMMSKDLFIWEKGLLTITYQEIENGDWKNVFKYTYLLNDSDLPIKEQFHSFHNGEWVSDSYEIFTWNNGNIIKTERWRINKKSNIKRPYFERSFFGTDFYNSLLDTVYETCNYIYDDKNNVYKSLGKFSHLKFIGALKNNKIEWTIMYGKQTTKYIQTIKYNEFGYPIELIIAKIDNGEEVPYKHRLFEYDCIDN